MEIATLLFTYNRPRHTEKVLNALEMNENKPSKLIIFQDGLKESTNICEWEAVNRIINHVDWCDVEVYVSPINKGLAESVVNGVMYAFDGYDAVIVLEDDCVPHPKFMSYMISGLDKYVEKEQVYSIGGYAWPVEIQENGADAYFTGRISSWGWGTWKNRWAQYKQDYQMLAEIKKNDDLLTRFHIWGEDLEGHLLGNVKGTCNSWAVFWALTVIKNKGYCLAPYQSLIENIGYDGSGTHCATKKLDQNLRKWDNHQDMVLPEKIEFPIESESVFSNYFSWTSAEVRLSCYNKVLANWICLMQKGISIVDYLLKQDIHVISIWGRGKLFDLLWCELADKIKVVSIVESNPLADEYRGISVVTAADIPSGTQLIIVIPIYDMEKIQAKASDAVKCKIVGIDNLIEDCMRN